MQVLNFKEEEKLKKAIAVTILAGFITMNTSPVFAIDDIQKSTATPKQFKSMVKKNKKSVMITNLNM